MPGDAVSVTLMDWLPAVAYRSPSPKMWSPLSAAVKV